MGWLSNAKPHLLYPREKRGTHYIGGWVAPKAGLEQYFVILYLKLKWLPSSSLAPF
jgi:hypothetical protein